MEIAKAIILIITFVTFFYLILKALYHGFNMINNVTGKYASFLGPLVLFMPSQFNEEGNKHRIKLYPHIIGAAVCSGVIFLLMESLNA